MLVGGAALVVAAAVGGSVWTAGRLSARPHSFETLDGTSRFEIVPALFPNQRFVVNFFASWCGPCRVEHPLIADLVARLRLPIVGISVMDVPENTRAYLEAEGNPYAVVGVDPNREASVHYGVVGPPHTIIYGRSGKLELTHPGPIDESFIDRLANMPA